MKRKPAKKSETASKPLVPSAGAKLLRSEWPLLVFPVLVIVALAILYGVSQSIEKELTPAAENRRENASQAQRAIGTESEPPTFPTETVVAAVATTENEIPTTQVDADTAPGFNRDEGQIDVLNLENLEGPARALAMLREAIRMGDEAQIKQCMGELVAWGDEAIGPLSDMIANGSDVAAVWAARALAQIGTPVASSVLLDTLAQIEDGPHKVQLVKEASQISNHESWPILLDAFQDTTDLSVQRAAASSLATMADKPVVDEIIARYEAATTQEEADRLAQMVEAIRSPAASESLLALAGDVSSAPQDGLEQAAVHALANIGDSQCVSYLLRRLEAAPPGEGAYLFDTISNISQPQAEAALQYAAAGSKDVSAEHGRTAAIYALENFPSEQTCALLEQIVANEDNASVVSAAARTLEKISNTEPLVAANAAAKGHDAYLLPSDPLKK